MRDRKRANDGRKSVTIRVSDWQSFHGFKSANEALKDMMEKADKTS